MKRKIWNTNNKISCHKNMTEKGLYRLASELYLTDESVFLIKVNGEEYCYVHRREEVRPFLEKLASCLLNELTNSDDVRLGRARVFQRDNGTDIILFKQRLGYLFNGSEVPVYTLTYVEIFSGVVRSNPNEEIRYITKPRVLLDFGGVIDELKSFLDGK